MNTAPIDDRRDERDDDFDVVIVGGGPAGTATGVTLLQRPDVRVAIVERTDYAAHRPGEALSPGTRPLLEYLGVWDRFRAEQSLISHSTRAVWGSPEPQTLDYMFTVHGSGWSLDRAAFDRMLADRFVDRGGCLLAETRVDGLILDSEGAWQISAIDRRGHRRSLTSRFAVFATGRLGRLSLPIDGVRVIHDRLVAIGGRIDTGTAADSDACIEVEACAYGWWYSVPVPSGDLVVMLLTDGDVAREIGAIDVEQWRTLLAETDLTSARVHGVRPGGAVDVPHDFRVRSCSSSRLTPAGGPGWLAVGDAASSHDPLSSTGISHALGTGVHGAVVVADALFGEGEMLPHHLDATDRDFEQYLRTHRRYYQRERRFPDSRFWQRRQAQISIDALWQIESVASQADASRYRAPHLRPSLARALHERCRVGEAAHVAVSEFLGLHPEVPDELGIIGMQGLVEDGLVSLRSTEDSAATRPASNP